MAHSKTNILQNPLCEVAVPSLSDKESEIMCENKNKLTGLHFQGLLSVLYVLQVSLGDLHDVRCWYVNTNQTSQNWAGPGEVGLGCVVYEGNLLCPASRRCSISFKFHHLVQCSHCGPRDCRSLSV